jgi:tetratricopeptide (TPR) repeat protein
MIKNPSTLPTALLLTAVLMLTGPTAGTAGDFTDAVISVVGLDNQDKPCCQGLGVVVGKDGRILTCASLLANSQKAVIRTNRGVIYWIRRVLYQDDLQDLILIKVDAYNLPSAPIASDRGVQSSQKLLVVRRGGDHLKVQKITAARTYPFSPRLVLLKIKPDSKNDEPGTPVFTEKGELVGLLHSPLGSSGQNAGYQFFLLHNFTQVSLAQKHAAAAGPEDDKFQSCQHDRTCRNFWKGVRASLGRDWLKAEREFSASLTSGKVLPEAYYGRGVARFHMGDVSGSLEDLLEATKMSPNYALAWLWIGRAWERRGDNLKAREAYQRAADQAPKLNKAWFQLGTLAYKEGDLPRAREYLSKVTNDFAQNARRWWYLGQIAEAQEQPEQALTAFRRALETDTKFVPAYLDSGKVLLELGRPREAVQFLNMLLQLQPKSPGAHYYLALAYLLSWNSVAAWEQYFTLQQISPQIASYLAPLLERSP